MRKFLGCLGLLIVAGSLLFVIVGITDLFTEEEVEEDPTEPGVLIGIIVFFTIIGIGGGFLVKSNFSPSKKDIEQQQKQAKQKEKQVLQIICDKNGRITPIELAAETELDIEESKTFLDNLCGKAGGELNVTDDGDLVYVFPVLSDEEKSSAKDPFDV